MKDTAVQPRVGASFLLTDGCPQRHPRQLRQALRAGQRPRLHRHVQHDRRHRGNQRLHRRRTAAARRVITPPTRSVDPSLLFDKDLHQPYIHEYSVGYNRQLKGQMSIGVAWTHRRFHDNFGGGRHQRHLPVDRRSSRSSASASSIPNQGIITKQVNNTWTQVIVNALEATFAKNMSNNFQLMASFTRQWQHLNGTWNPTDPALLRAAGRVREQPRPVAAAVRQRRRQHAERRRP